MSKKIHAISSACFSSPFERQEMVSLVSLEEGKTKSRAKPALSPGPRMCATLAIDNQAEKNGGGNWQKQSGECEIMQIIGPATAGSGERGGGQGCPPFKFV